MTRKSLMSVCIGAASSLLVGAGAFAQSVNDPSPQARGTASAERVTIVGCVERAEQLNPTAVAATGSIDSQSFVLMRPDGINPTAADAAKPTGTSGTAGPLYWLDAEPGQLNARVGQKVEVSGVRQGRAADANQPANATNPTAINAPHLKVESLKMIAETCAR